VSGQVKEFCADRSQIHISYEQLMAENIELRRQIVCLQQEIIRLKDQINKSSGNSSKPPSTDGFKKIPNSHEKSDKKTGGQPGHKGNSLAVPENLDELVKAGKVQKKLVDHTNGAAKYVSKWVVDIEVVVTYTEHRFPITTKFPIKTDVFYGNDIKALSVLLSTEGVIAEKRLATFFESVADGLIKPSDATIES
jgi:transposase